MANSSSGGGGGPSSGGTTGGSGEGPGPGPGPGPTSNSNHGIEAADGSATPNNHDIRGFVVKVQDCYYVMTAAGQRRSPCFRSRAQAEKALGINDSVSSNSSFENDTR